MKVRVERNELAESTMIMFEVNDHEIRESELESGRLGILRPPRIRLDGCFSNLLPKDWIQWVAWMAKVQLTF